MIVSPLNRLSKTSAGGTSVICGMLVLMMLAPALRAEESASSTDTLLENMKQRSAEERWQRIKKQYSNNSAVSRQTSPGQRPNEFQQPQGTSEIPPSPAPTLLIPRMTSLPADHNDDWLVPSPQIATDDVDTGNESVERSIGASNAGTPGNGAARPAVKVAAQEPVPAPMPGSEATESAIPPRALHERKISDITPFYDRDRDGDIRQFAAEKGRELDIEFRPKPYTPRSFPEIVLAWEATNFTYLPLYFSDPALERYGHSHHPLIQPIASIARVGVQFVFLPYQMTITPVNKPESPAGWYRPGDVVPKLHYQVPLNAQAAAVEAAAVTGLYFMIVP